MKIELFEVRVIYWENNEIYFLNLLFLMIGTQKVHFIQIYSIQQEALDPFYEQCILFALHYFKLTYTTTSITTIF